MHPHLEQYLTAVSVMRQVAAILKTWGIQPHLIQRFVDESKDDDGLPAFGYTHEAVSANGQIAICLELRDISEYQPIHVEIQLCFRDNPNKLESRSFCAEFNTAKNEWIFSYNDEIPDHEPDVPSAYADEFAGKYEMELDSHSVEEPFAAWCIIREMVEFFARKWQLAVN
ncbi:hypothetical protein GF391_01885 [Candidatus Uhrbacteria bacterium]|nr:hypothetical protein [Candidatus Uhrbacteria bacterium]